MLLLVLLWYSCGQSDRKKELERIATMVKQKDEDG
jgi:hypothetical protein